MSDSKLVLDMTPTLEGYRVHEKMFTEQIISSARKDRREAVESFLDGVKDIYRFIWFMDHVAPLLDDETLERFGVRRDGSTT
jgi:hypothetical protein